RAIVRIDRVRAVRDELREIDAGAEAVRSELFERDRDRGDLVRLEVTERAVAEVVSDLGAAEDRVAGRMRGALSAGGEHGVHRVPGLSETRRSTEVVCAEARAREGSLQRRLERGEGAMELREAREARALRGAFGRVVVGEARLGHRERSREIAELPFVGRDL